MAEAEKNEQVEKEKNEAKVLAEKNETDFEFTLVESNS